MTREIKKLLVSVIKGDSTILTLMGGTVSDPRIYPYYLASAVIDTAHPAYITYSNLSSPKDGALEKPVFSLTIWGKTIDIAESVRERVITLFDSKKRTTSSGKDVFFTKVSDNDAFQEQTNFAGKALHFMVGFENTGSFSG